jgi:hypothetical protein
MLDNSSAIYVRTEYQCLLAFVDNILYRVKVDPKLKQTYHSIYLGNALVYFRELSTNRVLVRDPIGIAVYNARMRSIKAMADENRRQDKCRVSVDHLFLIADREEMLDGRDLVGEPVHISGAYLSEVLIDAGYPNAEVDYGFTLVPEQMYLIPDFCIEDGVANLTPDNVVGMINEADVERSRIFA